MSLKLVCDFCGKFMNDVDYYSNKSSFKVRNYDMCPECVERCKEYIARVNEERRQNNER